MIVYHLWATAKSECGCWLFDYNGFAASISIKVEKLHECICHLEKHGHLKFDKETSEIFIVSWFRWHRFSGVRVRLLKSSLERIQSLKLKAIVYNSAKEFLDDKSIGCGPIKGKERKDNEREAEATKEAQSQRAAAAFQISSKFQYHGKARRSRASGIVTYTHDDQRVAEHLESSVESRVIFQAVARIKADEKEPLPGRVQKLVELAMMERAAKEKREREYFLAAEKSVFAPPLDRQQSKCRLAEAISIIKR